MEESLRTNDSVTQTASRYADMLVLPNSGMASVFGGYIPISNRAVPIPELLQTGPRTAVVPKPGKLSLPQYRMGQSGIVYGFPCKK